MTDIAEARLAPIESVRRYPLLRQLLWLALPVLAENLLHMVVGINDTYLANHVRKLSAGMSAEQLAAATAERSAAAAAVGTITYFLWFIGLIVGSIGAGSTAIIARASGARNRRLANSVCGQSVSLSVLLGILLGVGMYVFAVPLAAMTGLRGHAHEFALIYIRMLAVALPFSTLMFIANACLRGAGDSLTPAIVMIVVDVINIFFTFALTYGWRPFPEMGFTGIAAGTIIAYVAGGVIQFIVLVRGRGGIRLYLHRLAPHWNVLRRVLRIGLPSGAEGALMWLANFGVIIVVNSRDATNTMAAAHVNAVRIEALSYMAGFAVATAATTLVGQSLGMKDPKRAARSAYLSYLVGGGIMTLCGIFFIFFGWLPARWLAGNREVAALTTRCLFITGFIQSGFAAAAIFGGALRGAGDTLSVMLLNLARCFTPAASWCESMLGAVSVTISPTACGLAIPRANLGALDFQIYAYHRRR